MNSPPRQFEDVRGRAPGGVVSRLANDAVFRRTALVWFTGLLGFSLIVLGLGITLIYDREKSYRLSEVKTTEEGIVVAQASAIRDHLKLLRSDLLFMRDEYESVLEANLGDTRAAAADIAERYRNFSHAREVYDAIRIVGPSGSDAVRVDHNNGSPIAVDAAQLQDTSDGPDLSPSPSLEYDQISVSPLDLNIGDAGTTPPYRPTIRLATPVRTSVNAPAGFLVVNHFVAPLLSSIEEAAEMSDGEPVMLNAKGYWLVSADPLRAWGDTVPAGKDNRMEVQYPATWAAARTAKSGQVQTPEGLFTFRVIDPVRDVMGPSGDHDRISSSPDAESDPVDGHVWYVGTFVPADSLEEEIDEPTGAAQIYIGLILALCVVGAAAGAIAIAESRSYRRMLEKLATEDPLTGLANRRALEERLAQEIDIAQRKGRRVTVAFLDVDGFKSINDELGHAIGDQALVDIADVIEANVRSDDVVGRFRAGEPGIGAPFTARIGGDEFVIMFPDSSGSELADSVLRRICAGIRKLSWDGRCVSVSVGVATFPEDGATRDSLLKAADGAMYAAKTSGRDRIVLANADERAVPNPS